MSNGLVSNNSCLPTLVREPGLSKQSTNCEDIAFRYRAGIAWDQVLPDTDAAGDIDWNISVDGRGGPLAILIAGGQHHEGVMLPEVMDHIRVPRIGASCAHSSGLGGYRPGLWLQSHS